VQGGTKLLQLSAEEKAEFASKTADVAEKWAADLDKRGRAGSAVLKEYREALKAN
jgi:hypothetical protein